MFNFRFLVIFAGSLLAGLGLLISFSATSNLYSDTQNGVSPFDQVDDASQPDKGFLPMIAATEKPADATRAYTARPAAPEQEGHSGNSSESLPVPTEPPLWVPDRIVIPAIHLDAPVVPAKTRIIAYEGSDYSQWVAPNAFAAGWDTSSASLGTPNNAVFFGHHNIDGEVFRYLVDLQPGDVITLYSGDKKFIYVVALKMITKERNEPVAVRLRNAQWILPSTDERITLLTCWPYTSNTHRLIVVATPIGLDDLKNYVSTTRPTPEAP